MKTVFILLIGFYLGIICAAIYFYGKQRQKQQDLENGLYFDREEETIKAFMYSWKFLPVNIRIQLKDYIYNASEFENVRFHP